MPLVRVEYTAGVLEEGRNFAAGVEISSDLLIQRALAGISQTAMKERIEKLMKLTHAGLRQYVKLQYQTSGNALTTMAGSLEGLGGSVASWAPLSPVTLFARFKGRGYYTSRGKGDKPLNWTGLSEAIASHGIKRSSTDVSVRVSHYAIRFNEATRPVFVLEEINRLVGAIANRLFAKMRSSTDDGDKFSREPAVDTIPGVGLSVGETRPFNFKEAKRGRPKGPPKSDMERIAKVVIPKSMQKKVKAVDKKGMLRKALKNKELRKLLREYERDFGEKPPENDFGGD